MELEVEITRLGAQGDGVAQGPDGPIFVPFTLPGERARIEVEKGSDHAGLLEVLAASPDRIAPICPCFGACGGCGSSTWSRALIFAGSASRWWPR